MLFAALTAFDYNLQHLILVGVSFNGAECPGLSVQVGNYGMIYIQGINCCLALIRRVQRNIFSHYRMSAMTSGAGGGAGADELGMARHLGRIVHD